jgi:hypothetical protein
LLGEAVVIWLTFAPLPAFGHVNVGLIGLIPNLLVVTLGVAATRRSGHGAASHPPVASAAGAEPAG